MKSLKNTSAGAFNKHTNQKNCCHGKKFFPSDGLVLLFVILFSSCKEHSVLSDVKKLPDYPSASGIEYFNKQLFIMGDDARDLLITDSDLAVTDSIPLYFFDGKRISKDVKADLEAISLVQDGNQSLLLLLGSGSLAPYRNGGWLIDPLTKHADSIRLDSFYQRLKTLGLDVLNIEGVCSIPGSVILANRGNNAWRKNDLVLTSEGFWKDQSLSPINLIRMGANTDSAVFNGVSGLGYAAKTDQLLLSVSTENTSSNTGDGAIGKSYLWIVKNISSKKNWKIINPDEIIDLEKIDQRFKGQKIESVCVTSETNNFLHLVLAADNDDGSSSIFKLIVEKK